MLFVESTRMQDYHTSPAEVARIKSEVEREHPEYAVAIAVEGGIMLFETVTDYHTWTQQN